MYVQAEYGHHRLAAILHFFLKTLGRGFLTLMLGILTVLAGIVLGMVPLLPIGALSSVALQVLGSQADSLGVRLFYHSPGGPFWLDAYLLVGLILVMPVVVFEIVVAGWPKLVRQKRSAAVLAVLSTWLSFLIGVALGYALVIPIAVPWIVGIARHVYAYPLGQPGPAIVSGPPVALVWGPSYADIVSNLLVWTGLLVELPVAMYALAKLGAIHRTRITS